MNDLPSTKVATLIFMVRFSLYRRSSSVSSGVDISWFWLDVVVNIGSMKSLFSFIVASSSQFVKPSGKGSVWVDLVLSRRKSRSEVL